MWKENSEIERGQMDREKPSSTYRKVASESQRSLWATWATFAMENYYASLGFF